MKTVVLNECFLKDAQINRLKALGELEVFTDTTTEQQVIGRLKGADAAIADCYVSPLSAGVFDNLPDLKYLTINSTGYEVMDLAMIKAHNVLVSNISGFSTEGVAEHAMALTLVVNRHIVELDKVMREQPYEVDPGDSTQRRYLGFNLQGKTLGIVGLGKIGQRMAEMATAFGMRVITHSRSPKNIGGIRQVSLGELMRSSDVISIHTPLNPESENLIGEKELSLMQPHALLINTARGKVVSTEALVAALRNKRIGGAGLDVIAEWDKNNPLLALDNVILTPHSAWYTQESFDNIANMVVENVEAFAQGVPQNLIKSERYAA